MKKKIFIVNGYGTSGKDTFCDYCKLYLSTLNWRGYVISSVDYVKEVAEFCGWDGGKTPKDRKFLSDLKDALSEWEDVPYKKVNKEMDRILEVIKEKGLDGAVFFIMVREPKDIERYVKELNASTILVDRRLKAKFTNHADNEVMDYNYDWIIDNNYTLDSLATSAQQFCNVIVEEERNK